MPLEERLWPYPPGKHLPVSWRISSKVIMSLVGGIGKLWLDWATTTRVYNRSTLRNAVESRRGGRSMITVCNHTSCLDDPVLWGVLSWRALTTQNQYMRWSLAAADVCFTKKLHSWFFGTGRGVPVVRGDGVYQPAMDYVVDKLNQGEWVHTFPEGRINMNREFIRFKWGVGRLVADCEHVPIVIPIWHVGMDDILPNKTPYYPRIGKTVTVCVGNPLDLREDLQELREADKSPMETRKHITDIIQDEMMKLRDQAHELHKQHTNSSTR